MLELVQKKQHPSACFLMVGLQSQGLLETGDGFRESAVHGQGIAEVEVSAGHFRLQADGLAETADRLFQLPERAEGVSQVVVGDEIMLDTVATRLPAPKAWPDTPVLVSSFTSPW
jgi:hypothetical protein